MKSSCSNQKNQGLTILEVLVVVFVLVILAAILLPSTTTSHRKATRIMCVNNLREMSLASRIWEGNRQDHYPLAVSNTNGGAMEQASLGDVAAVFEVMSNELGTPKILVCPADTGHDPATNFSIGFSAKHISYFVGLDANEANPSMLLSGDDNFETNGISVKSGILTIPANDLIAWTAARHNHSGNVAITDGSVQQLNTAGLREYCAFTTNRIAIP
jgi:prepilin-type N-terminal cleavage/methylation domain-containing protein